jgi:YidC/Oxa1 family membrane protein insertase
MDSRRFLLAVILMIAVMVVTNVLLPPPPPLETGAVTDTATVPAQPQPPGATPTDSPAGPARPPAGIAADPAAAPAPADTQAVAAADPARATATLPDDTISVRSPIYDFQIATRDASLAGARLLEFNTLHEGREDEPVQLSPADVPGLFSYRLRIGNRDIPFGSLGFTAVPDSGLRMDGDAGPQTLQLTHRSGDDLGVDVAYTFDPDRYVVDVRMVVTGGNGQTPNLFITLPRSLAMNEENVADDERALAYVVNNEREGINSLRLRSIDTERVESGPLLWAAVKNKYFVTAALQHPESLTGFGGLIATPLPEENAAQMEVTLLPAADGAFAFRLFVGPQEPQRLAELGNNFQDVNPFGWRAFRPILRPLGHGIQWALYGMHDLLGIGYGWVLILFGVLIRIALWPLNAKAMRSQMKNMEIQPRLKEIQAKYKNQPEQLQKEMLRLYKEEGFNPMGGCLPMLVPLPILITLFFVFQSTIAFRGVEFLWLPDLSRADPLYILPVLLGVSMFLMQWLSTRSMAEVNPQMKFMMYAMPIFMTVIFLNFASGLNLYYAAMNFASIPQQIQIAAERKRFQAARGVTKA